MKPEICLGTAQFGMLYGITNKDGMVPESEIREILESAHNSGIRWLDTAQSYGISESLIGRMKPSNSEFKMMTKLCIGGVESITSESYRGWEESIQQSCDNLGVSVIDALLVHDSSALSCQMSGHLIEWLRDVRARGIVSKIGVSIYEGHEIEGVPCDLLEVVQLPLSIYDQRVIRNGTLSRLKAIGAKVFARSIFLQGLLLTDPSEWPAWIESGLVERHRLLTDYAAMQGCSMLELILGFCKSQSLVDGFVFGVYSNLQILEMIKSWSMESYSPTEDMAEWGLTDTMLIDPRSWPSIRD